MSKIQNLLQNKKFWTLVAALVAAFAAFFSVGCGTQFKFSARQIVVDSLVLDRVKEPSIVDKL